jgi:hypothetical protein
MRRKNHPPPPAGQTLDDKLRLIAEAFSENLARVADLAQNGAGLARQYAADGTAKMPKKHAIASTFALCEETLHTTLGELWWRCSMSESNPPGGVPAIRMVKTILAALEEEPLESYDEWPPIEEFMHDFSASSHTIPQISGKQAGYVWDEQPFRLMFAAESEMEDGNPQIRAHAITRDMVKLCLVECPIKAVVYRGYDTRAVNAGKREAIIDRIVRTINQCPPPGGNNRAWLLIGLIGRWPDRTEPYFHTLVVEDGNEDAELRDW